MVVDTITIDLLDVLMTLLVMSQFSPLSASESVLLKWLW